MNKKSLKILSEFSINSRVPIKELSKKIRSSQQSTSYMVKQMKKKYIRKSTTVVDAVKLGYTTVLVGLDYTTSDEEERGKIIDELMKTKSIISIQEGSYGVDLILEYCESNLSAFNKQHIDLIKRFTKKIETKFVYPIIVKYLYNKNYLSKSFNDTYKLLCGDRDVISLTENEKKVLYALVKEPSASFTKLVKMTKITVKTVIKIKKHLEKINIIKKYSCYYDLNKTKINRSFLFIQLSDISDLDKLKEYVKNNKNIIEFVKIIGEYHIFLVIESLKQTNTLQKLRLNFKIDNYNLSNIENIKKRSFLPLPD
jgi:DNA-binding Lrp family transcriptional regulator|tara:strand:- start:421 stop:1356 length:936 start_codon:yes stop_codon:yes gene_type:complete